MKARKVIITLELETDRSITSLRDHSQWAGVGGRRLLWRELLQVQANVVQPKKGTK